MQDKKKLLGVAALTIFVGAGCSNEAAYEMMQYNKQQACGRMAEGQAREDCLRGYEKTFNEYERERRRVVGNKKIAEPELLTPAENNQDESGN
ncbi:MAG: hypothetical protein ACI9MS_002311 [Glaciecola sp.]|jgi:hypothetical protein